MTQDALAQLADSPEISDTIREIDSLQLSRELGAAYQLNDGTSLARLQVAAILSLSEALDVGLETLILDASDEALATSDDVSLLVFRKWVAYLNSASAYSVLPSPEDLLFFASSGLLADRPVEVRSLLRTELSRRVLEKAIYQPARNDWRMFVRRTLTTAILYLVLQEDHKDVAQAATLIQQLAASQRQFEAEWLESKPNASRDAISLLGQYHLAQAVTRTAEFLLVGSLSKDGKSIHDFAPELARLLVKAEEYLAISNDKELLLWLNASAVILWKLRKDSIWVQGLGISDRLDELVASLAHEGRAKPVFSLLPSQRDALRQNLLDPTRIAVILQMPTSAGKTLLAEFSIVQTFEAYRGKARVVYVVPTRALATQVRRTLCEDLRPLGIEVSAAGSAFEEDPFEMSLLEGTDGIVVATPEKLDLMLRSHPDWFDTLRLIVVDEAHLLKEGERGVRLELLLANIRRERPQTRLLLLTPFMTNSKDIASWLGGTRGIPIDVHWRPSRILLGIASIAGAGKSRAVTIEWKEPHESRRTPKTLKFPTRVKADQVSSSMGKVVFLADHFREAGTILALCGGSRAAAETIAKQIADKRSKIAANQQSAALRLAIALAKHDYGSNSSLAECLEKGVAFHHSSLSPTLRYLIEDQVRSRNLAFIAATSTLAQGMNFPVSIILIHSVEKPRNGGRFSPSEFWNIAGRAGRVGMVDRGLVLFMGPAHRDYWESYSSSLSEELRSALLDVLGNASGIADLKSLYRLVPQSRPFIQYLAHAAANDSPQDALANLEELIQASLANRQAIGSGDSRSLRTIARSYLGAIAGKNKGYLKAMDQTGLGSFSFDELYAKIGTDPVLKAGPSEIIRRGEQGVHQLVEALKWLPELSLALGLGEGAIDVNAVATVVQGWMDGKSVYELSFNFNGDETKRTREAGTYINSTVSQTISWGAHAYFRGWLMSQKDDKAIAAEAKMLPAYIQYGVHSPEAAVASLLSVPRQFAEPVGEEYRKRFGTLDPGSAKRFKLFLEEADNKTWESVVKRSDMGSSINPDDLRTVWRQMQGMG